MRELRTSYLVTLLGADAAKDIAAFLQKPNVASRFDAMEKTLRNDWAKFLDEKQQKPVIQKWMAPPLEAAVVAQQRPVVDLGENLLPPNPTVSSIDHFPRPSATATEGTAANAVAQNTNQAPNLPKTPVPPTPSPTPIPIVHPPSAPGAAPPALGTKAPAPSPVPVPVPVTQVKDRTPLAFKLRNARQSERYLDEMSFEPTNASIRLVAVEIPAEVGLVCNLKTMSVEGTPKISGEFLINVRYRWTDDSPVTERSGKVTLYVNPDPKSLWKNLDSDRSDPLWKDDEAAQIVCGKERRIIAARKRGRSHAHVGSCCDDDFFLQHNSDQGWYLAIVADGAGSAKASRQGSRVAVRTAGSFLKETLAGEGGEKVTAAVAAFQAEPEGSCENAQRALHNALYITVGHAAHRAMKALFDEAQARPDLIGSVKDLSTTLLIGVARKFGAQWLCAAYWVGDGAVGVYRRGGEIQLLGEVDAGEYSGQTRFLDTNEVSQEALLRRTRFILCDDFTAFLLMTDGVSDPKFETEARLADLSAWDELWDDLQAGAGLSSPDEHPDQRLLEWLDFWSQGNHDDRTIAFIY
jgi:serine/threonine protein phosphatase PrpC